MLFQGCLRSIQNGVPLSNVAILSTSESTSSTTFSVETVTSNLGFEVTATLVSLSNNPAIVVDPEKNTLTIVFGKWVRCKIHGLGK